MCFLYHLKTFFASFSFQEKIKAQILFDLENAHWHKAVHEAVAVKLTRLLFEIQFCMSLRTRACARLCIESSKQPRKRVRILASSTFFNK